MSGTMAIGTFVGRLTRDAELKYTPSNTAICTFAIATDSRQKRNDQWVEEASFWDVDLWGKLAESLNQYLIKGKLVGVSGSLRIDAWEKDGVKHSKVKINAQEVQLVGSKDEAKQDAPRASPREPRKPSGNQSPPQDDFTSDIPF
jgi:single-strand DNA-binding protein